MRQRHVSRAELVDHPENAQVAADAVPGLDPDQARNLALGERLFDTLKLKAGLSKLNQIYCSAISNKIII